MNSFTGADAVQMVVLGGAVLVATLTLIAVTALVWKARPANIDTVQQDKLQQRSLSERMAGFGLFGRPDRKFEVTKSRRNGRASLACHRGVGRDA